MKGKSLMVPVISASVTVAVFFSAVYFLIHSATGPDASSATSAVASESASTVPSVKSNVGNGGAMAAATTNSTTKQVAAPTPTRSTRTS